MVGTTEAESRVWLPNQLSLPPLSAAPGPTKMVRPALVEAPKPPVLPLLAAVTALLKMPLITEMFPAKVLAPVKVTVLALLWMRTPVEGPLITLPTARSAVLLNTRLPFIVTPPDGRDPSVSLLPTCAV